MSIQLTEGEADQLAQFVKRVTFETCSRYSDRTDPESPYLMLSSFAKIRTALADVGFAPR